MIGTLEYRVGAIAGYYMKKLLSWNTFYGKNQRKKEKWELCEEKPFLEQQI